MSCKVCTEGQVNPMNVDDGILNVVADQLLGDELELKINKSVTLARMSGGDGCVKAFSTDKDGSVQSVFLSELGEGTKETIRRMAEKKEKETREREGEKYTNPVTNSFIKTD